MTRAWWQDNVRRLVKLGANRQWPAYLAHVLVACWVFGGLLFGGRVLFFRDLSLYYYPNYAFIERALEQGVWPLWNPMADAGAPFLLADPVDLVLVGCFGADAAMVLGPAIYLVIAMCGTTALARQLGATGWGGWAAGAFYGLSGSLLSAVNLNELFHAASWVPWVLATFLRLWNEPSLSRVAVMASLGAIQVATLSAEVLLQTAMIGLALVPSRPRTRQVSALIGSVGVAALLAAPVLLGARALLSGTAREGGFPHEVSFAWSARPILYMEALFPHFFGDVHTMTDVGFWGQALFPNGIPYLLSLYLGPGLFLLVALAGRRGLRLYAIAGLGLLLALGDSGPLEPLMAPWMKSLRVPLKFVLMSNLALCLLAGLGLDEARRREGSLSAWFLGPGLFLVVAGAVAKFWPGLLLSLLDAVASDLAGPRAALVIERSWPQDFLVTGALALGVGLALRAGRRVIPLAALLVMLDLAIVNEAVNTSAPADFYTLRPELAAAVDRARGEGRYRWFSYGVAYSPGLNFSSDLRERNSDVWLFYLDRQTMLPRTPTFDRLESAFGLDRVGWAIPGSTLTVAERNPRRFHESYSRLRMANVRWVLSFHRLPGKLVSERESVRLPGVEEPLRFFELRDPLPRALWVARHEVLSSPSALRAKVSEPSFDPRAVVLLEEKPSFEPQATIGAEGTVVYEPLDPHTIRVRSEGAPGWVLVLDNFHRAWIAESQGERIPLLRANGQYIAIPTAGGSQEVTLHFRPAWRRPALTATGLGLLLVFSLTFAGVVLEKRGRDV